MAEEQKQSKAAFFTRKAANAGVKLPLYTPAGEKTEHWVRILGVDSDIFRATDSEVRRTLMKAAALEGDKALTQKTIDDARLDCLAVLVADWSFPEPCTPESVREFLIEAPQIADAIDKAATKRALFTSGELSASPPTLSTSSAST